jgi:hypothetical protein
MSEKGFEGYWNLSNNMLQYEFNYIGHTGTSQFFFFLGQIFALWEPKYLENFGKTMFLYCKFKKKC